MSKRHLELTSSTVAHDSDSPNAAPLHQSTCIPSHRDKSRQGISRHDLSNFANDWLLDGQFRLHSPNTIATRRIFIKNLLWFLERRRFEHCGVTELKHFFIYLSNGHEEPGGRWGRDNLVKMVRPITFKDYYVNLCCLFNWLVEDGATDASPLTKTPKPKVLAEQVQPFTQDQIEALLKAARSSSNPKRDEAIVLFLYDTGVRASELCGLKMRDLDLGSRHASVLGKGNKRRLIYFSRETAKALSNYLRRLKRAENDLVFCSTHGTTTGEALTRSGLRQLIERSGTSSLYVHPLTKDAPRKYIQPCRLFLLKFYEHTSQTLSSHTIPLVACDNGVRAVCGADTADVLTLRL